MSAEEPRTLSETEKRAAQLLLRENLLVNMTPDEAMVIVGQMRPKRIPVGTVFITQGEQRHNDFLVLIIEGDAVIELKRNGQKQAVVVDSVGPGELLGEMSLLDGTPRAVSCRAATDMAVGILTRARLQVLIEHHPDVAARFFVAMYIRCSERMRETVHKLNTFIQMNDVLREQLDAVMNARLPATNSQH